MSCSAYLKDGLIKNKRKGKIISNFTKERLFHILSQPSALWGNLTTHPVLAPSKKGVPLIFNLAKKIIYLDTQLKGGLTDLF